MNPVAIFAGGVAGLIVTPVVALAALASSTPAAEASCGISVNAVAAGGFDPEQLANARIIVDTGEHLQVPAYGQVIAVATALQESDLRTLTGGDRDSVGLFQQRPSQGWGPPAQIRDPGYASTAFYEHLLAVPNWQLLPLTVAAQAVQRSAYPSAYAKWQAQAAGIVEHAHDDLEPVRLLAPAGSPPTVANLPLGSAVPTPFSCEALAPAADATDDVVEFAATQVGKKYLLGADGPNAWDCSALTQAAYAAAGVQLPRTADEQYDLARATGEVITGPPSLLDLEPGDLLFSPGDDPVAAADQQPIGHVAIYAGNGVVIEAKGAAWGVVATLYTPGELRAITFVGRLVTFSAQPAPSSPNSGTALANPQRQATL